MKQGREAKILIDGEEVDFGDVEEITVSFNQRFQYLELNSRYLDDAFHRCEGLSSDRVLISTKILKAIIAECLASRETIMTNRGVIEDTTDFDKKSFETDTALMIGAK